MPNANEVLTILIGSDIKQAEEGINKVNKKFSEIGKSVSTFALGAAAALGTFAVGVGIKSVNAAKDLDSAVKNLGRQVGASSDEMKEYEGIIKDVYKANIGENFQDVANIIGEVKKQTQLAGEELKNFTQYAATFGKVYDAEINETTRSANMLIQQFGLNSQEAFNLMTQGMEQGLNKNDDFLDSVNEYSVHFKNLGFNAEEMFDLYVAGAQNGAFSIDKLGDSIKEFSLKTQKQSDDITKLFKGLGLSADETYLKFAKGGDIAKSAFDDILKKLRNVKDETKKEELGTIIFGTMWEDLGSDVVLSLLDVKGAVDSAKNSADALNSVDYTDFDSMLAGLGRTIEVDLLVPLGQELYPILDKIIKKAAEGLPGIIDKFKEWGGLIKSNIEKAGGYESFWNDIWSVDIFVRKWNELKTELGKISKMFTDAFGMMGRNAGEKLGAVIASAYTWGRNLIQSFLNGMFSMFTSIAYVAKNAAAIIRSYLGWYSPTEKGPGADSDKWGPNLMNMISQGISMNIPAIEQSVSMTAGSMENGFNQNIAPARSSGGGTVQLINSNIYNETMLNMLLNRIKKELVSGGI